MLLKSRAHSGLARQSSPARAGPALLLACAVLPCACGSSPSEAAPANEIPNGSCPRLESYRLQREVTLSDVPMEASGITYDFDRQSFFIVANLQGALWEYDHDFTRLLRSLTLNAVDTDTEGAAYLGQGYLAVVAENNQVYVVGLDAAATTFDGQNGVTFTPAAPPAIANAGFEGLAYQQPSATAAGQFFVCQEHQPMRVLRFADNGDRTPGAAFSALQGSLDVVEAWQADSVLSGQVSDLAGAAYDESNGTLLLVSQESSSVLRVSVETGSVLERLALSDTTTSEGVTLFDGCKLAVVSEPNRVQIYVPN